jgi:DNA-binding IclR family transcriptional regulator
MELPQTTGVPVFAVQRTLQTLEYLAEAEAGVSVAELCQALGIEKSIASRLLSTLVAGGYVVRVGDGDRFELSLRLIALAFSVSDRLGFPGVCQPVLHRLSEETGELAQLAAVERDRLVFVANAQGTQRLAIVPTIGRDVVLHATASGKAWLASLATEQAVAAVLHEGLTEVTPRTITRLETLLEELERVRQQGYATVEGEFTEGVNAIAVAFGQQRFQHAVGAIVLSAPSTRFATDRMTEMVPIVRAAAGELEAVWPHDVARVALDPQSAARRGGRRK